MDIWTVPLAHGVESHQSACRYCSPFHLCVQAVSNVICIAVSCWSPRACNDRIRETHQLEVFAIHGSLAGTSTLRFSLTLHAACENPTPIRLCQAHAGYRSGRLVPLYIRPVFYPPSAAGLSTLRAYRAHASEIPLCLFSAPQPVCSFLIETIDGRLLLALETSILVQATLNHILGRPDPSPGLLQC
jgi:hypothetical protein